MTSLLAGKASKSRRMVLILSEKNSKKASGRSGGEILVGRTWTLKAAHELVRDGVKLFAGGAVTDLCVRVLAPGSNMEGMDLGLLLDVDISVHSEICLPPVTLSLLLLAFGLLQLCRHP